MTDMIGDFPLHLVQGFNWTQKDVRLEGHETSMEQLTALKEMFSLALANVISKDRPGGTPYIMDLTADQRNIRYCNFTSINLISGWYALKSIQYTPKTGLIDWFPYRITLYYIGTSAGYQEYYEVEDLESVSNDWSL